jgi:rhodanese-related sulfurtransferase
LWQEIQDGSDILIVDTRNEDAYAEEHIEGAISVPSERIEAGDWQPPLELYNKGYQDIKVLERGLEAWKAKGYPVVSGDQPR